MEVVEHQDIFWSDQRIFVIMKKGLAKLQTIGNIFNLTMRLLTYLQNKQRKEKTKNKLDCVILKTLHCERIASKITFCDLPISRIACPKQRGRYLFNTFAVNLTVFIKHQWYFDYKMSILLLNMQRTLRWTTSKTTLCLMFVYVGNPTGYFLFNICGVLIGHYFYRQDVWWK